VSADHATVARRRRTGWGVLAVVLALTGVVLVLAGLHRSPAPARPVSAPTVSPIPASEASRPHRVTHRVTVPRIAPVHLAIPAIHVSHRLLRLGLQPDRTVEVPAPEDSAYPGWFRLGPTPGQVGSSVILGHVDSVRGPAVFYDLRFLSRGDKVDVRLRDGTVTHFAVRRVATYANADFPADRVYAAHGVRALNLVTCGGEYDRSRGGYQSNVVVYTRLVGTTPAAGARSGSSSH